MKASTGRGGVGGKSLYTESQWTRALFIPSSKQLPLAWITAWLIRSSVLICCSGRSADSSLDFSWRYGCNSSVLLGSVASISISRQTSSTGTDPERESSQPSVCAALRLPQAHRCDYLFMSENLFGKQLCTRRSKMVSAVWGATQGLFGNSLLSPDSFNFIKNTLRNL